MTAQDVCTRVSDSEEIISIVDDDWVSVNISSHDGSCAQDVDQSLDSNHFSLDCSQVLDVNLSQDSENTDPNKERTSTRRNIATT